MDLIIQKAAYWVSDDVRTRLSSISYAPGSCSSTSTHATFYTFDGEPLATIPHEFCFPLMDRRLDPGAPKIKPASFQRIWWPAHRLGFGMTKGAPGYAVYFYDKNGNRFAWKRMDTADEDVRGKFGDVYDLTESREDAPDFSLKESAYYVSKTSNL